MELLVIFFYFFMLRRLSLEVIFELKEYFINFIDLFGYIDFSSEVLMVLWLCDGVVVLVDVVEGVCS